jgi:hypothetical protein
LRVLDPVIENAALLASVRVTDRVRTADFSSIIPARNGGQFHYWNSSCPRDQFALEKEYVANRGTTNRKMFNAAARKELRDVAATGHEKPSKRTAREFRERLLKLFAEAQRPEVPLSRTKPDFLHLSQMTLAEAA